MGGGGGGGGGGGCLSFICLVHTDEKPFITQVDDQFRANDFVASSLFPVPPSVFLLSKLLLVLSEKTPLLLCQQQALSRSMRLYSFIISYHIIVSCLPLYTGAGRAPGMDVLSVMQSFHL